MTCKFCNHVNEVYAERCINCGNLLNEKNSSITKAAEIKNISPIDIALKDIKNAWIAGLISIGITITFTLISMSGTDVIGLDASAFIDVFQMIIFTFGIYKKSRTCAILMLALFIFNKILMWQYAGVGSGLPLALVFLWYYSKGVIGTFQYHNHINKFGSSNNNA